MISRPAREKRFRTDNLYVTVHWYLWRTNARICQVLKSEVFNFLCNVVDYLHVTDAYSFAIHDNKNVHVEYKCFLFSNMFAPWLVELSGSLLGMQIQLSKRTLSYLRTLGRFSSSSEIVLAGSAVTIICQFLTYCYLQLENSMLH